MNNETNIDVQYVSPLKKICMTIGELPASYLETMSYYEMLVWFTEFLKNTVIPTVNNNAEAVSELQALYEELREYVNNYFDNLDIQEEINNKLDEMAEDGTLTNLIKGYIDPIFEDYTDDLNHAFNDYKNEVNDNITTMHGDINLQNSRINQIEEEVETATSGSPKGVYATVSDLTTADPDHDSIYLVLDDGNWYYYNTTNSEWTSGGTYQSSGIGENAIDLNNLNTNIRNGINAEIIEKAESSQTFIGGEDLLTQAEENTSSTYTVQEINLNKGDIIKFTAGGNQYTVVLSMFLRKRDNKRYFKPLIMNASTTQPTTYTYTALYEGKYYICSKYTDLGNNIFVYRKNKNMKIDFNSNFINNIIKNDNENITSNSYIMTLNGNKATYPVNNEFYTTDYISILPDKTITLEVLNGMLSESMTLLDSVGLYLYDNNKNGISGTGKYYPLDINKLTFKTPNNARYIRFTITSAMYSNGYALYYSNSKDFYQDQFNYLNLYSSFRNVGVVGDSLASGECCYKQNNVIKLVDLYEYSWPQFMARMSGNNYINFSSGGQTTESWLTSNVGYTKALIPENKCEAYYIALGVNDANTLGMGYLGSSSDIDTSNYHNNENSFYGNYAGIIQRLKEIQPKAKFFLLTMPREQELYTSFNTAIKEIATMFTNCYVLDLVEYINEYSSNSFNDNNKRGGHYNANSYNNMAQDIALWTSKFMYENYTEFSQIEFIGTDYEWTD